MKTYNTDLHYHSPYAAACSKNISIPVLAKEAKLKGLNLLTTADILHPIWSKHVKDNLLEEDGCYFFKEDKDKPKEKRTYFILGVEVETTKRVHHLLYFKNWEHLEKFRKKILPYSSDMEKYGGGRPRLSLTHKQLLDMCIEFDVPLGPAHAFTPYFGVYSHYNSLEEAYGENWKKIKFIELGLSADTNLANVIPDIKNLSFFSFSDSHSPKSFRIGREYVAMQLEKPNFDSFIALLDRKKEHKVLYNIGYNPQEGKYNATACRTCAQIYSLEQAISNNWRCIKCKGIIKKGVKDRIKEVAVAQGNKELKKQIDRPDYRYLIPLAQVIQIAIKQKNILHKTVLEIYDKFVSKHTEIDTMQKVPEEELKKIDENITKYIIAFRNNYVVFRSGGAGHYGIPHICFSEREKKDKQKKIDEETKLVSIQKTLF